MKVYGFDEKDYLVEMDENRLKKERLSKTQKKKITQNSQVG